MQKRKGGFLWATTYVHLRLEKGENCMPRLSRWGGEVLALEIGGGGGGGGREKVFLCRRKMPCFGKRGGGVRLCKMGPFFSLKLPNTEKKGRRGLGVYVRTYLI